MRVQSSLQSVCAQIAGHDAPSQPALVSILPFPWCRHVLLSLDRLDLILGVLGLGIGLGLGTATTGRTGEGGGEEMTGAGLGLGGGSSSTGKMGLGTWTDGLGTCKMFVSQALSGQDVTSQTSVLGSTFTVSAAGT